MSSFKVVCIHNWIKGIFPKLRKTQSLNLTLAIFGLIKARSGLMSEIVRMISGPSSHKYKLKRLWRFVSNEKIKPANLIDLWALWIVGIFCKSEYIPVALDWTTLPGNIQCLMAAVPFAGRAVPLLWVTTTYQAFKDSQNLIEQRLVTRLINIIPKQKRIILIADRGFGRAKFFKFLLNLNILFAIRVRADVKIKTLKERTILLRKLKLKHNQIKWFPEVSYREDGFVPKINLAATVAEPKAGEKMDPWLIATNLKSAISTISRYESRFHIEEWFKDLKHELGIADLQVRNAGRARRMILIAAIAYGLVMLVGTVAQRLTKLHNQLITGGKKAASRVWFALRLIQYQLLTSLYWKRIWLKALGP